jgi:hypothetical protein
MILTPEQPRGCPKDTAPPFFTLLSSRPKILELANQQQMLH